VLTYLWVYYVDVQIGVTENHIKANTSQVGRRVVGVAGPSCALGSAAAGGRAVARRMSSSSQTSSSSLSSTGSRRSVVSHSSNLSYSQDDVDSTGKPHDPAAANLEIHEVKVVFLKVSIYLFLCLLIAWFIYHGHVHEVSSKNESKIKILKYHSNRVFIKYRITQRFGGLAISIW